MAVPPSVAERGDRKQARVRAHHEHFAVREIDQLEHAVDHRVTERDERDHRPLREPIHERVEERREKAAVRRDLLRVMIWLIL